MTFAKRAVLFAGLVAAPVCAQAQVPADPKASDVKSGAFTVEPQHTQIGFGVSHMGFTTYYGWFNGASGMLKLTSADPAASTLQVSVPTASVTTTSDKLNAELRGADWLDAARFPTISFSSTGVLRTGPDTADVTGNMTLHGVTKPVVLHAKFMGAGVNPLDHHYTAGFSATGTISRSAFGVTKYVPLVGDEVALTLSGAFEQK